MYNKYHVVQNYSVSNKPKTAAVTAAAAAAAAAAATTTIRNNTQTQKTKENVSGSLHDNGVFMLLFQYDLNTNSHMHKDQSVNESYNFNTSLLPRVEYKFSCNEA